MAMRKSNGSAGDTLLAVASKKEKIAAHGMASPSIKIPERPSVVVYGRHSESCLPEAQSSVLASLSQSPRPNPQSSDGRSHIRLVSLSNFESVSKIKGVLNSPRSLKACKSEGVSPTELLQRNMTDFMGPGVPENIVQMRHAHYEHRRKEKLERVCRAREKLVKEERERALDVEFSQQQDSDEVKEMHISNLHGHISRSSSSPYKTSMERSNNPSNGRPTWDGSYSRCLSVGAMMIYSRVMSEQRLPSEAEILALERIQQREHRNAEAKERMAMDEKVREKELISKQLEKSRRIVHHMVNKENEILLKVNMRRRQWEEKLQKVRERQRLKEGVQRARNGREDFHQTLVRSASMI